MNDEPIVIEEDGGWVRFTRLHGDGSRPSQDSLELPCGFTLEHVLAAVDATPWVVERHGERRIQGNIGCDRLAQTVAQMFSYFDRPDQPSDELLNIRDHVASRFPDTGEDDTEIPLWAYAWLDLAVREDLADAARSAGTLWNQDRLTIDVAGLRDQRIRELLCRWSAAAVGPADQQVTAQRMTPSARRRQAVDARGGRAGLGSAG
ncbi:MAG TPA: hypothetical protein VGX78_10940 [Pirellulales bacterium]|jgi:hypothetical protein|nr:hypothetical protein [Pirellulales bacterium]